MLLSTSPTTSATTPLASATKLARYHQEEPLSTADGRHRQDGVRTKVLLISATPVNNDLKDLRNQIYFLTEGSENDGAFAENLGIESVKDTLDSGTKSILSVGAQAGL